MEKLFEVLFLEEVYAFLGKLETKHSEKIIYNIRKSQNKTYPELFKKLKDEIWEFRTLYQGLQYRLLAFWDKTDSKETIVVTSNGFVKKQSKVPNNEIERAKAIRKKYFEDKEKPKKK